MNWFALLQLFLQLAAFIARRVDKADVEKAFADALTLALDKRADAAVAARDDVLSGRVPDDGHDPNRRD